jgi:hypothetical protein
MHVSIAFRSSSTIISRSLARRQATASSSIITTWRINTKQSQQQQPTIAKRRRGSFVHSTESVQQLVKLDQDWEKIKTKIYEDYYRIWKKDEGISPSEYADLETTHMLFGEDIQQLDIISKNVQFRPFILEERIVETLYHFPSTHIPNRSSW